MSDREEKTVKKSYKIEVDCANCANLMEEAARKTDGVKECVVSFMTQKMKVEFEEGADAAATMQKVLANCRSIYQSVRAHMEELFSSSFYTNFAEHTAAVGKLPSFLTANLKKIILGAVAGAVIACGLWFLAGLAPEFHRDPDGKKAEKEAAKA